MEDFAVGKPNQEVGADACGHALKRARGSGVGTGWEWSGFSRFPKYGSSAREGCLNWTSGEGAMK